MNKEKLIKTFDNVNKGASKAAGLVITLVILTTGLICLKSNLKELAPKPKKKIKIMKFICPTSLLDDFIKKDCDVESLIKKDCDEVKSDDKNELPKEEK